MADGLDVVPVGIADERAVVAGVVLGPEPGFVQDLGPLCHGSVEEGADRGPVGRVEGEMGLPEPLAGHGGANPEFGVLADTETDDFSEVHRPRAAERREDGIVERDALRDVRTLNRNVVNHGHIMTPRNQPGKRERTRSRFRSGLRTGPAHRGPRSGVPPQR